MGIVVKVSIYYSSLTEVRNESSSEPLQFFGGRYSHNATESGVSEFRPSHTWIGNTFGQ